MERIKLAESREAMLGNKGRSCGYKGPGSRKSRDRFYNSEDFMINCFKVLPCFKKYRHDWWVCPYAHEGETAKRRDPKKFQYVGVACPDAKQGKPCPRGDECPCTHNVFEYWLHPTRFRTAFCGRGIHCTRPFCFFAHSLNEMRKPSLDDLLPVIQGNSLFNEEMLKHALEDHKKDVARLGGKDTCSEFLDLSFLQVPSGDGADPLTEGASPRDSPPSLSPRDMMRHMTPPRRSGRMKPSYGGMSSEAGAFQSPMRDSAFHSPMRDSSYHSPMRDSSYHSPMRDSSYNSPMHERRQQRDQYLRSPRDLSPGPALERGRYRRSEESNPGMLPNMQSPREVLTFMNAMLKSPRDLSPENLRYVQNLRAEAAALMTATPSPRDLSPHAKPFNVDGYGMHSPRGAAMDPSLGAYETGSISPSALSPSPRDVSPGLQGVDGATLLEAMSVLRDMSPSGQMDPLHGKSSFSPRDPNWRGRDGPMMKGAGLGREHGSQRRTAGVYESTSSVQGQGHGSRSPPMASPPGSSLSVRELLEVLQRSNSGTGALMPQSAAHISADGMQNSMPMHTQLDGLMDGPVPLHESLESLQQNMALPMGNLQLSDINGAMLDAVQTEAIQEALLNEAMPGSSLDVFRSSPPLGPRPGSIAETRGLSPAEQIGEGSPPEGADKGIPPSLQAVLRSLSKEDGTYYEGSTSNISRPFSSLSGLW